MPESTLPTESTSEDPSLPITMEDEPEITMREFLTEQRRIIASKVEDQDRCIVYMQQENARMRATLAMLDEQLAESAQPLEPWQQQ